MVLQKRLDYGSRGHQIPALPHVPKSSKGKRSVRKKVEDKLICAFDLLATVAGNLLLEGGNSACQQDIIDTLNVDVTKKTIKQEQQINDEKLLSSESSDQQSVIENVPGSWAIFGPQTANELRHDSLVCNATTSGPKSGPVKSEESHPAVIVNESIAISNNGEIGCDITTNKEKCYALNSSFGGEESHEFKGEGIKPPLKPDYQIVPTVIDENAPKLDTSQDPMDLDAKPPLASSDSSAEVPLCRNNDHPGFFPKDDDGKKLVVDKDDDESSSGCTDSSIPNNKVSRPQRITNRRMRKLKASKHWKLSPHIIRDHQFCNYESKPVLHNNKIGHTRQRTQRNSFKRKKLAERYSGLANLCRKRGLNFEQNDLQENIHRANGPPSSASGNKLSPYDSSDYHVKLRINSLKVPELYIDIPETATVGSLKQTIVEAVTAILEGGLNVGVFLEGKKVRDDSKTLRQAGICHVNELDRLGFMLEPNPSTTPPLTSTDNLSSHDITDDAEPLARMPPVAPMLDQGTSDSTPQPGLTSCNESDHDSVQSATVASLLYKTESDSHALVAVPPLNAETLAVVPLRKTRRSEAAQRRIRRPFSVTEVEALVQAVEKLGTGRWRDVKLRAFENAKHRTYVDLKDKWKTLVHTAKISPQQRRGEPVPQELLNRVLSADAYWSHHQAKLQIKSSPHELEPLSAL